MGDGLLGRLGVPGSGDKGFTSFLSWHPMEVGTWAWSSLRMSDAGPIGELGWLTDSMKWQVRVVLGVECIHGGVLAVVHGVSDAKGALGKTAPLDHLPLGFSLSSIAPTVRRASEIGLDGILIGVDVTTGRREGQRSDVEETVLSAMPFNRVIESTWVSPSAIG